MTDPDQHLTEIKLSSQELLKGRFLHAFSDSVQLPNGQVATREYVVHPGAVMVVPMLQDEIGNWRVVLERQFRYPVKRVMIEFPAGKLDPGETSLACAQRELMELWSLRNAPGEAPARLVLAPGAAATASQRC